MSASATKTRDAARTRRLILDAAERVFAHEGYDAASLARVGEAAGVSRGTPSYFFGSKAALLHAVLERMYRDRTETLGPAFAPLVAWAQESTPSQSLRAVLETAVDAYLRFLVARPTYVDIIEREALAGGARLAELEVPSTVMEDAFAAVRRQAHDRGLRDFDVAEVVICLTALGYMPIAHRHTLLRRHGRVLEDPRFLARHRDQIVDVLVLMMLPGGR